MDSIILKGSIPRYSHELKPLKSLKERNENSEDNIYAYKVVSNKNVELTTDKNKVPVEIIFSGGPTLKVGERDSQTNMLLKDICAAFNHNGEYMYVVLIFEK